MKIRIVSDVHCDINKFYKKDYDFGDDFVICCGDISGDRFSTEEWVNTYMKKGLFIGGNHLGYNDITNDEEDTLTKSIEYLQSKFNKPPVLFLENQTYEIDDIVFVGCILFTDFLLFNNPAARLIALMHMNDYKYVKIWKRGIRMQILPKDQFDMHKASIRFIKSVCKNNPDKKIIVVSHHAPSFLSVPEEYKNDNLSAAYASNLEKIIKRFDNLKLWCHGHMHSSCDYTLYGTRVICNPRGYYEQNLDFKQEGVIIETDDL